MGNKLVPYVLCFVFWVAIGAVCGWWVTHNHYQSRLAKRDLQAATANTQAQAEVRKTETASQNSVATIDQKHYKELQNAKKTIDNLRNDVAAGRIGLHQCNASLQAKPTSSNDASLQAEQATVGESAGMGDNGGAEQGASGEAIEYRILGIAEDAMMAAAQRDACVAAYQQAQTIVQQ